MVLCMRKTKMPDTPLGRLVWDFRGKFHLSQREAAPILGISASYVMNLERGCDIKTGLPFTSKDITLRAIAENMTAAGYPVSFDEIKALAGGSDKPLKKITSSMLPSGSLPRALPPAPRFTDDEIGAEIRRKHEDGEVLLSGKVFKGFTEAEKDVIVQRLLNDVEFMRRVKEEGIREQAIREDD